MIICPLCKGLFRVPTHLRTSTESHFETRDCSFCSGLGVVEEVKAKKWYDGERLRQDRIDRKMTLRDEAKRLGIPVKELSNREWGRI